MKKEVQGRWGRVATRCAAIAERDEVSRREDDIIMHKGYDLPPAARLNEGKRHTGGGRKSGSVASHTRSAAACEALCSINFSTSYYIIDYLKVNLVL